MAVLTREALITASDLKTRTIKLESLGGEVVVQGLGSYFASEAASEAMEVVSDGRQQTARVNKAKLESLQVFHGLVDPKLNSLTEAEQFLKQCGPAAQEVIDAIDELSAIDKEAIENAEARFPDSGAVEASGGNGSGPTAGNDAAGDGA